MSAHLKQLKQKFIQDAFVADGLGAVIDGASYGFARVSMWNAS